MRKKILIVDDSATARALFKACMHGKNEYEVLEAGNANDALNKAKSENPFLIVLDYNMPEKNGAELAEIMKQNQIKSYFVLMSANTQSAIVEEVKNLGFIDVIEKPVSSESIQTLLEKLS